MIATNQNWLQYNADNLLRCFDSNAFVIRALLQTRLIVHATRSMKMDKANDDRRHASRAEMGAPKMVRRKYGKGEAHT